MVNSALTLVVKRSLENDSDKRKASLMGQMIDLAIDFFISNNTFFDKISLYRLAYPIFFSNFVVEKCD